MKSNRQYVFLIFIFLIVVLLTGCGGYEKEDSISVNALLSGNHYEFSFPNYHYEGDGDDHGKYFETKTAISEIMERISQQFDTGGAVPDSGMNQMTGNSVNLINECVVVNIDNGDSTFDQFAILPVQFESKYGTRYILTPMNGRVLFEDVESEISLLLPIHLISDARIVEKSTPILYEGAEYEVFSDLDGFYDFYISSGWYEAEKLDNKLIIRSYLNEPRQDTDHPEEFDLPFPIEISFSEHAGQTFFCINR